MFTESEIGGGDWGERGYPSLTMIKKKKKDEGEGASKLGKKMCENIGRALQTELLKRKGAAQRKCRQSFWS